MLPLPSAPAYARSWLRDCLEEWGAPHDELFHDAVLVVDELVTNAVLHAATPFVVTLAYEADRCRCSVTDRRTTGPLPCLVDRADGTGRGLRVVDAIAAAWHVERAQHGTTVSVEIVRNDPSR